jgi:phosphocarrier protein FPr/phosphocarrier protein
MIETPAAAVTADLLAAEADFLSIGANDLTQYVLAMDRGDPVLASRLDALHPAVLRMIGQAGDGAAQAGRSVSVCGAVAADPLAAPILIGLGARSLSVPPAAIAALKARLRDITLADCVDLARRAVAQDSAASVRSLAAAFASGAAR